MNRLTQEAILIGLARRLAEHGSWAGETHLQKACYLLAEIRDIEFDFDFILYKHGPFSFELRDELSAMKAEGLIESVIENPRYGARLQVTDRGVELEKAFKKTMQRYGPVLDEIAETLGSRGVMDLERLATALWMTRQAEGSPARSRAEAVVAVKPHISVDAAQRAVEEIDELLVEAA